MGRDDVVLVSVLGQQMVLPAVEEGMMG